MVAGIRKQNNSDGCSSSSPRSSRPASISRSCQDLPVYETEGQGQVASSDGALAGGIQSDVEPKSRILGKELNRYVCIVGLRIAEHILSKIYNCSKPGNLHINDKSSV